MILRMPLLRTEFSGMSAHTAALTTGVSSDAIDDAIQANIVAAGYGK